MTANLLTSESLKARARRRRDEGGAVLFIVAMTLAVLASLGMYALTRTSDEVKTSGYARQAAQAHYLAEYGILGEANDVNPQTAQLYLGLMRNASRADTKCISLPQPQTGLPYSQLACRRMGSSEIATKWIGAAAMPTTPYGQNGMAGDFFVELTDPVQAQPPQGFDLRLGLCFAQFTVTSIGLLQPTVANSGNTEQQFYGNEGVEMARARFTAGPIRCQQ